MKQAVRGADDEDNNRFVKGSSRLEAPIYYGANPGKMPGAEALPKNPWIVLLVTFPIRTTQVASCSIAGNGGGNGHHQDVAPTGSVMAARGYFNGLLVWLLLRLL
jgi:hypothetical protein